MKLTNYIKAISLALILAICGIALSQSIKTVNFAKGAKSTTIKSSIRGDKYIDYNVQVPAGGTLGVKLKASNPQNYFNVTPPGSDEAIFIGSTSGNTCKQVVKSAGTYTIRVYLMRAAGRRNESSRFTLQVSVTR